MHAEPAWPAVILAAVQLADAGFCAARLGFIAVSAHLRKRDVGRNLLNATALLGFSGAVAVTFS